MSDGPLCGAVAMVVGASGGIGAAIARSLSDRGAAIALVGRRADRLDELAGEMRSRGGSAVTLAADITDAHRAETTVAGAVEQLGRLDLLVNCAGVLIPGDAVATTSAAYAEMVSVNVLGLAYVTLAALPHLVKAAADGPRGVADLVNISSVSGRHAYPNASGYTMTKFGVTGFSESLRQELAPSSVRVAVVEPGAVDTGLVDHRTRKVAHAPLAPADVADAVSYIVTRPCGVAVNCLTVRPTGQVA